MFHGQAPGLEQFNERNNLSLDERIAKGADERWPQASRWRRRIRPYSRGKRFICECHCLDSKQWSLVEAKAKFDWPISW